MAFSTHPRLRRIYDRLRTAMVGPQMLAFLPAVILGGFWFGGEGMLLFFALFFPALFAIAGLFSGTGPAWSEAKDRETNLCLRATAERSIDAILASEKATGKTTAAIVLSIDEYGVLERQYGTRATGIIIRQTAERLVAFLRDSDSVVRLDGPRFAVALGPTRRADLETLIQLSARIQAAIAEPFSVDATRIFISVSIGFCLVGRAPSRSGTSLLEMAECALDAAIANGNGSIRAYTAGLSRYAKDRTILQDEIANALDGGQILPWYQPQVSTHTGEITGFEALARWVHPKRGLVAPAEFLPMLQDMGLLERLSEEMVSKSLAALRQWKIAGLAIPSISVNFSSQELSNPKLCERLKWELDRFDHTPDSLCVEILEDVIGNSKDDIIVKNIQAMAEMGCKIDLDDFGTGHASIANIRRFSVNRIKIDRSFITRVDRDRDQQNMVAAILTMAERLAIETLAEGVETVGEHAILAQLGCGHVQGFSIAKPMPIEDTENWILQHRAMLPAEQNVGRKSG